MSDLPTLYRAATTEEINDATEGHGPAQLIWVAPIDGDLLSREEAANAMMAFLDQHGGDVGQHWPTMEDALAWLGADDG